MLKIKTLKHCENLLKVSNKIKQYVKNTIARYRLIEIKNGLDKYL